MENSINRSEKKKSRFNIVDALIIIIAFVLAIAAFFVIDPFDLIVDNGKQTVKLRYIVEFDAVNDDVSANIILGESVSSSTSVHNIGTVTDIKSQQAYLWEKSDDGRQMVKKTIEGKSNMFITIEVECVYENGIGYFVNGQQIAVGTLLQLRFSNFVGSGYCVSIEKVE